MTTRLATTKELGALIREERRRQGLTQVQLADLCGVSPRFVGELESGRSTAGFGRVLRVSSRLGIDLYATKRGEGR